MILSASREFDRNRNPLIVDRLSDNVELPKVCFEKQMFNIESILLFSYFENYLMYKKKQRKDHFNYRIV